MSPLEAALAYVARGWPVFPCRPRGKAPATARGFKDAGLDPQTARIWWQPGSLANVAIPTGLSSSLVVLDVDPRNGVNEALAEYELRHGKLPETAIVHTGGGGLHFYFAHPAGEPISCRPGVGGFAGLDLKGDGGYVLAPPSVHPSGGLYEFDAVADLETPLAPCPAALVELGRRARVSAPLTPGAHREYVIPLGGRIPEGCRNDRLFRIAAGMRARGESESAILGELLNVNVEACDPPLDRQEVEQIAASAGRYPVTGGRPGESPGDAIRRALREAARW